MTALAYSPRLPHRYAVAIAKPKYLRRNTSVSAPSSTAFHSSPFFQSFHNGNGADCQTTPRRSHPGGSLVSSGIRGETAAQPRIARARRVTVRTHTQACALEAAIVKPLRRLAAAPTQLCGSKPAGRVQVTQDRA